MNDDKRVADRLDDIVFLLRFVLVFLWFIIGLLIGRSPS